jgi:hypothetical protein
VTDQVGDEGAAQLAKAVENGGSKKLHTLDVSEAPTSRVEDAGAPEPLNH